jgi:hypothetical protein
MGTTMLDASEDTEMLQYAVAYAIKLYRELTAENGAPSLGTQNQVAEFILADPELCRAVAQWGRVFESDQATTTPARHLPCDGAYRRVKAYFESIMEQPVFTRPGQEPADRR